MDSDATYDVVIVGAGSGGKPLAGELSRAGISVVVAEQGLVGGECPYLACVPSKAMLIEARHHLAHGPHTPESHRTGFVTAVLLRDKNTRHRDDSHAAEQLTEDGAELVRGRAVIEKDSGAGHLVTVTGNNGQVTRLHASRALVISTGSAAVLPPVDGLEGVDHWTSDGALTSDELPESLLILGGGPIGCELAQVYASFGTRVTLVQVRSTLLPQESTWLGEAMKEALTQLGITVLTDHEATAVRRADDPGRSGAAVVLTVNGQEYTADRLLIAAGKKPRTAGFGLEELGLDTGSAIPIDARCHAITAAGDVLDDVYALGDVTGVAPYTHTANYHARTVAAHLQGDGVDADHTGIPRVVYTNPAVLCAGLTAEQASDAGHDPITARFDARQTSRSAIERTAHRLRHEIDAAMPAEVELVADASTGVLLGAFSIGSEADSWAAELALAVRSRTTVQHLAQALHAYPSWAEALHPPARELAEKVKDRVTR